MSNKDTATQPLQLEQQLPAPPPYPGYCGEPQQPPVGVMMVKADGSYSGGYVNSACMPGAAASGSGAADPADVETGGGGLSGFTMRGLDDRDIRRGFIRKVYLILFAQLIVTFAVVLVFSTVQPVRNFARGNFWLFHLSYAVFFIMYFALVCVTPLRRKFPGNFISLSLFTLSLSFMAGVIASCYSTNTVAICLGVTAAVCLCVTLFAVQTRFDFTLCSGVLFGLSLVVFFFGLSCAVTFAVYRGDPNAAMKLKILDCVYGGLLALVFVLFLVFDTQRVVGGRRHNLSEEEYVFGAMQIYVDVVYIFIILLGFSRQ